MSELQVLFEVPKAIEAGLSSGVLQRVGGVIVDSATKQVVAWLRDGGSIDPVREIAGAASSPLSAVLSAVKVATTLIDGKFTRDAVQQVGEQVAGVSRQVQTVTTIASLTATGQIVNLALAGVSFYATMQRLDRLTEQVTQLGEVIRAEFARDRELHFRAALEAARDVFDTSSIDHRNRSIDYAIDGLFRARSNYLEDFDRFLESEPTLGNLQVAQQLLIRAIYAEISRVRCLAVDDIKLARNRLLEVIPAFQTRSGKLVAAWIGKHPSAYLHSRIAAEDVERFFGVQTWRLNPHEVANVSSPQALFAVLDSLRKDFWTPEVPEIFEDRSDLIGQVGGFFNQISGRGYETSETRVNRLMDNLTQAEIVIENYQRLQGFELELRSMRLQSFEEWRRLVDEEDLATYGMGLVVDTAVLQ